jgi:streptogramin lyase
MPRCRLALCISLGGLLTALVLAAATQARRDQVTEFPLPRGSAPVEITMGAEGNLWFTELRRNQIGRITPSGQVTEFRLDRTETPRALTAGPEGNIWFTAWRLDRIGRVTPSGQVTEFPVAGAEHELGSIVAGSDGNLWFTDGNKIGRITPSGQLTDFPLPARQESEDLTAGPDGNLWFNTVTITDRNKIGRITPSGQITEFPIPCHSQCLNRPGGGLITTGPDGNLWFTTGGASPLGRFLGEPGPLIGQVTPSGQVADFRRSIEGEPSDLASGPDGNLWFTESVKARFKPKSVQARIGRITPNGLIAEFPIPGAKAQPWGIAAGPDGDLWFTEPERDKIGRITPGLLAVGIAEVPGLVKNGWTRIQLDCSGGAPHQICRGMLRLEFTPRLRHTSQRTVFAARHYRMRSGTSKWIRLHLSKLGLLLVRRFPVLTVNTASVSLKGGQGASDEVGLEEHPVGRRIHRRR